jgi:hypothetical protein
MREYGPLQSIDVVYDFWPDYLERNLFNGLNPIQVNSNLSYPLNKFFNETEFEILLRRILHHGIGVLSIHARGDKACGFELYDWQHCHITNKEWIPLAYNKLKKEGDARVFMADLYIFDEQLQKN